MLCPGLRRKKQVATSQMTLDSMVLLRVRMHCPACVTEVKSCLQSLKGVLDVHVDSSTSTISVKGTALDPAKLGRDLRRKTGKKCEVLLAQSLAGTGTSTNGTLEQHSMVSGTSEQQQQPQPQPQPQQQHVVDIQMLGTTTTTTTDAAAQPHANIGTSTAMVVEPSSHYYNLHGAMHAEDLGQHPLHVMQAMPKAAETHQLSSHHVGPTTTTNPTSGIIDVGMNVSQSSSAIANRTPTTTTTTIAPHESLHNSSIQTTGTGTGAVAMAMAGSPLQMFQQYDESRRIDGAGGSGSRVEIKQQIHTVYHGWPHVDHFQHHPPYYYTNNPHNPPSDHYYICYPAAESRYQQDFLSEENPNSCHIM